MAVVIVAVATVVVVVVVVALVAVVGCDVFFGSNWTTSSFLINHGIFVSIRSCSSNGSVGGECFFVYIYANSNVKVYNNGVFILGRSMYMDCALQFV